MARPCPYLQRRGETYFFRIFVPLALRQLVGTREITKTLGTRDRRAAQPVALQLGSIATRLFHDLRTPGMSNEEMIKLLERARQQLQMNELKEQHAQELFDQRSDHIQELREARREAEVETLRRLVTAQRQPAPLRPLLHVEPVGLDSGLHHGALDRDSARDKSVPTLGQIIDNFLAEPETTKKPQMLKKHLAVLGLLKEVAGNKLINNVRQADIKDFFGLVGRLPPKWSFEKQRRRISASALAAEKHPELLGPKTFEGTYVASVKVFLKYAISTWQDQGLPATLTTEGIKYQGDRKKGENKQRAFKPSELASLFGSSQMRSFKKATDEEHKFWLPAIGLYTGARVNEICQLNPQTDILHDPETDIHYFWITEDTASDERVRKTTKNESSRRRVPIHTALIKLGILDYITRVKVAGSRLLFPEWKPVAGRASRDAEEWFRDLLSELGLRDETPGFRIVGMHAFRSTLLARASNSDPAIDATPITGHSGEKSKVVRGYEGELDLDKKKRLLEAIDFKFDLVALIETPQA